MGVSATRTIRTVGLAAVLLLLPARGWGREAPWEAPPFTADPRALQGAAQGLSVPAAIAAIVLRAEAHYTIDRDGRVNETHYHVVRPLTRTAVGEIGSIAMPWAPWHQARPTLRARVISEDGRVNVLDPGVLGEAPARQDIPEIYVDERVYGGPLPAVAENAILEMELGRHDTAPFFGATVSRQVNFSWGPAVRVLRMRVVVDIPHDLPFHYVVRNLPAVVPRREAHPGHVRWIFEGGPIDPPTLEDFAPLESPQRPYVAFATGASWAAVARQYSALVEAQLQGLAPGRLPEVSLERGAPSSQIAARLLQRLQRDVRYTGVAFGDAAIVPRRPTDVLARGFGDCKDQATLLVAMLRAAGVPAEVALLATQGPDPEPALPALRFDHAIAVIPGSPMLWIDPTDPTSRVGELPASTQGRLALVAAAGTTGLVRTPESSAAHNRQVRTHEWRLHDFGPGRVLETTESYGAHASLYRAGFDDRRRVVEHLQRYVNDTYLAEGLGRLDLPAPADAVPVLRVEALRARRGYTEVSEAAVAIDVSRIVARMPQPLLEPSVSPRVHDFVLEWAASQEWRYLIVAPPGFRVRAVPAPEARTLGPAHFSREFRLEADGTVRGVVRFDSGPRRVPASQVDELRAGLVALRQAPAIVIEFDHVGERHLAEDNAREALVEFRALVKAQPTSGLQRMRIARALLAAGLGEAARAEARSAVALEPSSAVVHRLLGRVLEADLVGRPLRAGFDRAGAEAAYRRALALDPADAETRAALAVLLEHDDDGVRYSASARLAEAIAEYRRAGTGLTSTGLADNLPLALMHAGRFQEMKDAVKGRPGASRQWASLRLVALATTDGPAAAAREAASLNEYPDQRREALAAAVATLTLLRRYELAADLADLAAPSVTSSTAAARAAWLRQARRHDQLTLPDDDPQSVVRRLLVHLIASDAALVIEGLKALSSQHAVADLTTGEDRTGDMRTIRRLRARLHLRGAGPAFAADAILTVAQLTTEGRKESGFRVRATVPVPGSGSPPATVTAYVVWEGLGYRLLGVDDMMAGVARLAWERADAGDLNAARQWLDWLSEGLATGGEPRRQLSLFWTRGATADREVMLDAAAALVSLTAVGHRGLDRLRDRLVQAGSGEERLKLRLALATASLTRQQAAEAVTHGQAALALSPTSGPAFGLMCRALLLAGRPGECRAAAIQRLQNTLDEAPALRLLATAEAREGQYAEAEQALRRLVSLGRAEGEDWNRLAWGALFRPPVTVQALRESQQSLEKGAPTPARLHTLAMVCAELGKIREARDVLWQMMDVASVTEPDSEISIVIGRIAEELGATGEAVAAYRRVMKPDRPGPDGFTSYALAQRRLSALGRN